MSKILATPKARAMAKQANIDLADLKIEGRKIESSDVENYLNSLKSSPAPAVEAPKVEAPTPKTQPASTTTVSPTSKLDGRREKIAPIRKAIARAMTNSWNSVAYVNLVNQIDVTDLWKLRKSVLESVQKTTGIKLTFLAFIAKAILIALSEYPIIAAKYDETANEIVYPDTINLGLAVDTEAGLMVPVIKNAQTLSIVEIASEIVRLAKAARERKIKPSEMQGGSFTITNYGSVGSLYGVPVINYPELAIAGVGAIIDSAEVKDGQIVAAKIMHLTVAADHRWIDGATIGRFAARVKELLEKPEILGIL
ncbi:2-oxo acid dehydrogenase subunit E2 [Mesomycoplasma ovipneumoniae]|uniref:2-oxo acid dehydrogenase subunit E2 n=1 Tax=Mesomycoplasma ovipneumoniae TaxID=29562 RepID=A0AAW6Q3R9_9BACT|nr:2-oxo acid dehydrogenase subunit E2 [Mesomycoplasma ovipneumoniae]MDF9627383.1 2-oxo acid dehydrogenase subunit E2 [Mesomycoplasma ovipneumoniae]MDO4157506.1 2-oxo acid dehydrogenase subunit E2 [Mesomycoplasma ovipneumoniae]MDO4158593.1 2-oxo acid dehydrogenase subunit E2 [Mesomycoplasma ovipneumoniae]MDO6821513.1 2-oxo acid dehydrogenase subunit E2 [Mesomycoplasma ovipneumoniae]MDO6856067.1 2-oxo acid dehydrogenase subunit E2 [Mesomycoplasma ovipneumoniae]